MIKLLIVCGPTATGKTALARKLAAIFDGELVSADSRQVYKGMDVGTGKELSRHKKMGDLECRIRYEKRTFTLKPYDLKGIPIWLYDVVAPDEDFSVAQYQKLGRGVISFINGRKKLPIVVGGTGLYIKALTQDIGMLQIPPDETLRSTLAQLNLDDLAAMVKTLDEATWKALNVSDRQNPRRLIRKIEVIVHRKDARVTKSHMVSETLKTFSVGLTATKAMLYRRVDERVEKRVQEGAIAEVRALLDKGYAWSLPSMSAMGYREWKRYFTVEKENKEQVKNDTIEKWKYDEHKYVRHQLTWFNKQPNIHWFDITDKFSHRKVEEAVRAWYTDG